VTVFTNTSIAVIFATWFLLSLIGQSKADWMRSLKARDVFHLIPNWRFFAPIPARRDYHLEYRTKGDSPQVTPWSRIDLVNHRRVWCVIWNPTKRIRKSFNTQVRRLTRVLAAGGRARATQSLAYLSLLNHVQHSTAIRNVQILQFRIVTTQDFASDAIIRLVFKSDWHYFDRCSTSERPR
jgi:hypothetical protein